MHEFAGSLYENGDDVSKLSRFVYIEHALAFQSVLNNIIIFNTNNEF